MLLHHQQVQAWHSQAASLLSNTLGDAKCRINNTRGPEVYGNNRPGLMQLLPAQAPTLAPLQNTFQGPHPYLEDAAFYGDAGKGTLCMFGRCGSK
jgi:hypothetical protein